MYNTQQPAEDPQRFRDPGTFLMNYLIKGVMVHCPRCEKTGEVRYQSLESGQKWQIRFHCAGCALVLNAEDGNRGYKLLNTRKVTAQSQWFGAIYARGMSLCPTCGASRHHRVEAYEVRPRITNTLPISLSRECGLCGNTCDISVSWYTCNGRTYAGEPTFGLPLLLSETIGKGQVLWAYNGIHLADLQQFIAAPLREHRVPYTSYFMRLPGWMKTARNRKRLLAVIAKMEKQLVSP